MRSGDFGAMGTTVEVWGDDRSLGRVRDWFEEVECCASRFRPTSDLSTLNRDPSSEVVVSPLLGRLLEAASGVRRLTEGLVDPAVGADVVRWGYDRTFDDVSDLASVPAPGGAGADWWLDGQVVGRPPGTVLDLGGVAKGWAADVAIERGIAAVVSAGGDIRSAQPETEVPVIGPDGDVVGVVALGIGALATSSTSRRRWRAGGRTVHHVIDPRTGDPATGPVVSATALAATATLAEAAAKAVLIHGVDGLAWASDQAWVDGAMVVWEDGTVYATVGVEVAA